jgi:RNA polymerase sigma-70 factor (ECF subfamily)
MSGLENSPPMDLGAVEPNELVRRARGGCADSCAELSRRFRPGLLKFLAKQLGGRHADAEDIAQEALARAFQHFDRFDPRYRFSTWLYTIATRLAHDDARSRRRQPKQVSLCDIDCASSDTNAALIAQQQEEAGNLWEMARRVLSRDQYAAMWLRYGEDLSPVEIAKVMRKTRIGVRILLHRARLALVAEIGKQGGENRNTPLSRERREHK